MNGLRANAFPDRLRFAIFAVAALLLGDAPTGLAADRIKMVVAPFEVPQGLGLATGPVSLTNLLMQQAADSRHYELVLPNSYLSEIMDRLNLEGRAIGDHRELQLDPAKVQADALFAPTVARGAGDRLILTASVIDVKTSSFNIYRVESDLARDGLAEAVGKLWRSVDVFPVLWKAHAVGKPSRAYRTVHPGSGGICFHDGRALVSVEARFGKVRWKTDAPDYSEGVADADTLYDTSAKTGELHARRLATGEILWSVNVGKETTPETTAGDLVICKDRTKEAVVALRKRDGATQWSVNVPWLATTPIAFAAVGDRLVIAKHSREVTQVSLADGRKVLEKEFNQVFSAGQVLASEYAYYGNGVFHTLCDRNDDAKPFVDLLSLATFSVDGETVRWVPIKKDWSWARAVPHWSFDGNSAYLYIPARSTSDFKQGSLRKEEWVFKFISRSEIRPGEVWPEGPIWGTRVKSPLSRGRAYAGFSSNQRYVYVGSGNVYALDRKSGAELASFDLSGKLFALVLSEGVLFLATNDGDWIAIDASR
jgi:outer membrane protein assembly factor BamB